MLEAEGCRGTLSRGPWLVIELGLRKSMPLWRRAAQCIWDYHFEGIAALRRARVASFFD